MNMAKKYTAVYEYGNDGWWTVSIREVRGVHTQGRSIAQARTRVREALGLFVDGAETAQLVDDIRVGAAMLNAILKARRARQAADRQQKLATLASRAAAKKLVAKMSVRDAGEVLGVSHQYVQQLAGSSGGGS
ncbi:MAG TPA: type II toxin-antitoxin system HicB family antitoxin [Polyangia bacterium]|nr:type II toxin-antitoxin system HicB family antitoxin [Polyangia bacterium]